jgi:hypothetical protein
LGVVRPQTLAVSAAVVDIIEIGSTIHGLDPQVVGHCMLPPLRVHPDLVSLAQIDHGSRLLITEGSNDCHIIPHFSGLIIMWDNHE